MVPPGQPQPAPQVNSLFKDVHQMLNHLTTEVEYVRKVLARNDEALRHEIEDTQRDIDDETFERKDSFNRLKYEFEGFVHRKNEKVIQELEEISRAQQGNDSARQKQLNTIGRDLDRLKVNLLAVQAAWARLATAGSEHLDAQRLAPPDATQRGALG